MPPGIHCFMFRFAVLKSDRRVHRVTAQWSLQQQLRVGEVSESRCVIAGSLSLSLSSHVLTSQRPACRTSQRRRDGWRRRQRQAARRVVVVVVIAVDNTEPDAGRRCRDVDGYGVEARLKSWMEPTRRSRVLTTTKEVTAMERAAQVGGMRSDR